jgi:predicted protein tyrosine phosphatase
MKTPYIQNISRQALATGQHLRTGDNTVLIQIADCIQGFPAPTPNNSFVEIHQFNFMDSEENDSMFPPEAKIAPEQAKEIVGILRNALANNQNVIVHCNAGLCRSGAVAEVGVMMGFTDTFATRIPNLMVKKYLMRELGWLYEDQ